MKKIIKTLSLLMIIVSLFIMQGCFMSYNINYNDSKDIKVDVIKYTALFDNGETVPFTDVRITLRHDFIDELNNSSTSSYFTLDSYLDYIFSNNFQSNLIKRYTYNNLNNTAKTYCFVFNKITPLEFKLNLDNKNLFIETYKSTALNPYFNLYDAIGTKNFTGIKLFDTLMLSNDSIFNYFGYLQNYDFSKVSFNIYKEAETSKRYNNNLNGVMLSGIGPNNNLSAYFVGWKYDFNNMENELYFYRYWPVTIGWYILTIIIGVVTLGLVFLIVMLKSRSNKNNVQKIRPSNSFAENSSFNFENQESKKGQKENDNTDDSVFKGF